MSELNKAEETLSKNMNVRILQLPPYTVASYQYIGEDPEEHVAVVMEKFIRDSGLYDTKPDSRFFGFNHPNPGVRDDGLYGYEVWVTVPEDMEIPEPLTKKHFDGGLYAAYTIKFGEFYKWRDLAEWGETNDE